MVEGAGHPPGIDISPPSIVMVGSIPVAFIRSPPVTVVEKQVNLSIRDIVDIRLPGIRLFDVRLLRYNNHRWGSLIDDWG